MTGTPPIHRQNRILHRIIFATLLFLLLLTIIQQFNGLQRMNHKEYDYTKLINISFSFIRLPLTCQHREHELVVLVHSAPENKAKRTTIRDTWGHRENRIKVFFMLGDVQDETDREALANEFEAYGDLVQGSFLDSYHNLTYKHVMTLKYAVYHCPEVKYVIKVDDDVFINVPNLKEFIRLYKATSSNSTDILCYRMNRPQVMRTGKWAVSMEEYSDESYPDYCLGFTIIYPRKTVSVLYSWAQKSKYFWIDDVHITGIMAKEANITHAGINRLILSKEEVAGIVDLKLTNVTRPFLFGPVQINEHQIRSMWDFVKQHTPKASILDFLELPR